MATRAPHSFTHDLTRIGWVLAPQPARRARPVLLALLLACVAAYATSNADLGAFDGRRVDASVQPQADAAAALAGSLQHKLEQVQLALEMAQARGRALERELAAMNERLHTAQEELTFFRSAGRGKR